MHRKTLMFAAPVALSLALVGCDNREEELEAQIADLQMQLQTAEGDAATLRSEAEEMRTQLGEMEESGSPGAAPDTEAVRAEFEAAVNALRNVDQEMVALETEVQDPEVVSTVRTNLEEAARAIDGVAQAMGIELEEAAGGQEQGAGAMEAQQPVGGGQQEAPAGGQQEPAAGQTTEEGEEPRQQ